MKVLTTLTIFIAWIVAQAQTDITSGKYKLYKDKTIKVSFLMPVEWEIIKDDEGTDMAFPIKRDTVNPEAIFFIQSWGQGICDSAFLSLQGFEWFFYNEHPYNYSGVRENGDLWWEYSSGDGYTSSDIMFYIKGKNWKGYRHQNSCVSLGDPLRNGAWCDTIYFYDGRHNIIKIYTNGHFLEEKVRNKLIESFKFL